MNETVDHIRKVTIELFHCEPKDLPKINMVVDEPNLDLLSAVLNYAEINYVDFRNHLMEQGHYDTEKVARVALPYAAFTIRQHLNTMRSDE